MEDDIVADPSRQLDQAPVQGNCSPPGTRTPARFLVSHRDAIHHDTMPGRELGEACRQFPGCPLAQVLLDGWPQVGGRNRHLDPFGTEPDNPSRLGFQAKRLAAEKDRHSKLPNYGRLGLGGQPLQLLLQPADVSRRKIPGGGSRPASRNGDPHRAVRPQAQQVAARTRILHQQQRHRPPTDLQSFCCGPRLRAKI